MIFITSFFKTKELPEGVVPYSAAVYQPRGYTLEKAGWTDIRIDGKWIRPRLFLSDEDPAAAYWRFMMDMYRSRTDAAHEWLETHHNYHDCALCCWCPFDRAAKRQLEEHGTFICHTGPLGAFLEELGVEVLYDKDRERMYEYVVGD